MSEKLHLDNIDHKILSLLMRNARTPFLEIARECNISGAAIHQRVRKLEEMGVVEGSRMLVKPRALGLDICAFVNIKLSQPNLYQPTIEDLKAIPEVVECHFIVGQYSLLVKLYCRDNGHLMDLLVNKIPNITGVSDTSSFISLDQPIEREISISQVKRLRSSNN